MRCFVHVGTSFEIDVMQTEGVVGVVMVATAPTVSTTEDIGLETTSRGLCEHWGVAGGGVVSSAHQHEHCAPHFHLPEGCLAHRCPKVACRQARRLS